MAQLSTDGRLPCLMVISASSPAAEEMDILISITSQHRTELTNGDNGNTNNKGLRP